MMSFRIQARPIIVVVLLFITGCGDSTQSSSDSILSASTIPTSNMIVSGPQSSPILEQSTFENESLGGSSLISDWEKRVPYDDQGDSIFVTNAMSRSGSKALKFIFNRKYWNEDETSGNYTHRTEIFPSVGTAANEIKMGEGYWIAMSSYIPCDWKDDYELNDDLIWQFHGTDGGPGFGKSPALHANIEGGNLRVGVRPDNPDPKKPGKYKTPVDVTLATFPTPKGIWTDWVLHVKFDYKDGFVQIWRNGVVVSDYKGSTIYHTNDQISEVGPYLKVGIYKPQWGLDSNITYVNKRTLYYDDIVIADDQGSCALISPLNAFPCGRQSKPPNITLTGDSNIFLRVGQSLVDPGATALDDVDGVLTKINVTGTVDPQTPGAYELTYSVTNSFGKKSSAQRTITVVGKSIDAPPVIDVNLPGPVINP